MISLFFDGSKLELLQRGGTVVHLFRFAQSLLIIILTGALTNISVASAQQECGTDEKVRSGWNPELIAWQCPQCLYSLPLRNGDGKFTESNLKVLENAANNLPVTLADRIANCGNADFQNYVRATSQNTIWALVSRVWDYNDETHKEVWFDFSTKTLWSDKISGVYTHQQAIRIQPNDEISQETACQSQQAAAIIPPNEKFRLPTRDEYEIAERLGVREVLPRFQNEYYWSSSRIPLNASLPFFFRGDRGTTMPDSMYFRLSVRCVAKPSSTKGVEAVISNWLVSTEHGRSFTDRREQAISLDQRPARR